MYKRKQTIKTVHNKKDDFADTQNNLKKGNKNIKTVHKKDAHIS
jgi:hypothetical protein